MTAVAVAHQVIAGPARSPVIVLSNSLGSTAAMWDKQVDTLSQCATVVRYDTRGHGASPVPDGPYVLDDLVDDVVALLDSLSLHRVHFVGLSLGGMTGLRLAARNPERVSSLVGICTSAYLEPQEAWHQRAQTVRAEGAAAVARAVVERWYTPRYAAANPQVIRQAEAMVAATSSEGYAGCCEAIAVMDLRSDLRSICAPTLAIAGQDDPATPPAHLDLIARSVSQGQLQIVAQSAHLANDEQPAIVSAAVLAHVLENS